MTFERLHKGRSEVTDASADDLLTGISVAFVQQAESFDPISVFPVVGVDEPTGRYKVFTRADMLRTDATLRADGAEAAIKTVGVTEQVFATQNWALRYLLTDRKRKARGSPFANDSFMVKLLTQDLMIRRAKQWATAYLTTGVWGTDQQGGGVDFTSWNNSGTILANIISWSRTVRNACGKRPNFAVMTGDVWDIVQNDDEFVGRLQPTDSGQVTLDYFAQLIGIPAGDVHVLDVSEATSEEDAATTTTAAIDTEKFLIGYKTDTPDIEEPSAGYTFSWSEFDDVREMVEQGAASIRTYRDDAKKGDYYEGDADFDFRAVTPSAALLAYDILS